MAWLLLFIAGLCEAGFAYCLARGNQATGMQATWWYTGFVIVLIASMLLLIKVTQTLPIGTAYAVWTGIGAVATAIIGIVVIHEPATFWRLFFIVTLIGSVIGLKAVS